MIFRPNFHHEGNYRHDCMKREILTVEQKKEDMGALQSTKIINKKENILLQL